MKIKNSHTQKTMEAYNKNAQRYQEIFGSYQVYIKKISDFQKKFIEDGAKILDLGCGPGNNIATILKNTPDCCFTGVDLSKQFIKTAKTKFPQFEFIQKNILEISSITEYDIILASFCIVHLTNEETEKLFRKVSALLKKNGAIYISYMSGAGQGFESTSFSKEQIFFNYYDDQFIYKVLNKNFLRVVEISKEEYMEQDGSITIDTFIYAIRDPEKK
ncbi:MAG: methylase [Deltaproteobacteria bacterium]|nr:MAG: methylase [Deltaproteobacteria bacterium]